MARASELGTCCEIVCPLGGVSRVCRKKSVRSDPNGMCKYHREKYGISRKIRKPSDGMARVRARLFDAPQSGQVDRSRRASRSRSRSSKRRRIYPEPRMYALASAPARHAPVAPMVPPVTPITPPVTPIVPSVTPSVPPVTSIALPVPPIAPPVPLIAPVAPVAPVDPFEYVLGGELYPPVIVADAIVGDDIVDDMLRMLEADSRRAVGW